MTDLISRPAGAGASAGRPGTSTRSLAAAAALGGAVAAAVTLAVCMSVALTGWFLADAGAHGETTDALRVGADGWLMGHGSRLVLAGTPLGITPLAITMILVLGAFRAGRWSARGTALTENRTWVGAVATFVCTYLVLVVAVAVLSSESGATTSLPRAVFGAVLIAAFGGGTGLAVGSGRFDAWMDRVPGWAREIVAGGVAGALSLLAAAAVLVGISLLLSFNEAATALSELQLSTGDAVAYTVVAALVAPNAVLFSSAYLLGPGFSVGVGTSVTSTTVSLGLVPAFPMLAALPDEGPAPGWLVGLYAVPVLAAALGVGLARHGQEPLDFDLGALRGAGAGFISGVLIAVAISLSGGPMGTGRLTDIGAPTAEVLVFATGLMSVGGLLGGLVCAGWQRRTQRRTQRRILDRR